MEIDIVREIPTNFSDLTESYNQIYASGEVSSDITEHHSRKDYEFLHVLWQAHKSNQSHPKIKIFSRI